MIKEISFSSYTPRTPLYIYTALYRLYVHIYTVYTFLFAIPIENHREYVALELCCDN